MFVRKKLYTSMQLLALVGSSAVCSVHAAGIEEITVTAQKRSESTQDVPISITAFGADSIKAAGISGTDNLQLVTPGLTVGRQTAGSVVFIRGIGSQNGAAGEEPSVSTYVDGVYMISPSANAFSFNNIERVEVLKGPQGTLFGRNATGGLIHIITKDPTQETGFDGEVLYGNYDTLETNLYATTGLSENLAGDIAIHYVDQGEGYGKNRTTGKDVNQGKDTSLRSKLVYMPNDDLKITFIGDYTDSDSSYGIARQLAPGALAIDGVTTYTGNWQDMSEKIDPKIRVYRGGASLKVDYDFGEVKLVNISAYRHNNIYQTFNQGSTPIGLIDIAIEINDDFASNELQILSDNDSRLSWIVGTFFMKSTSEYLPLGLSGPAIGGNLDFFTKQVTTSYSAFAESTYELTESTSITAGARYTYDKRELDGDHFFDGFQILDVSQDETWSEPTWRLALKHDINEDFMVYASYNRGFKSGVFSNVQPADPAVNPELVDAYEIGLKATLFDGRLQSNLAAFYYDYQDIQLTKAVKGALQVINAAEAEIKGVEASFSAAHGDYVTTRLGISYVDGEYTKFPDGPIWIPNNVTGGNDPAVGDLSGNDLIRTPEVTVTAGVSVAVPTESGEYGLDINYYYSSSFPWEADNHLKQSSYDVVNAEIHWRSRDERWTLKLFGKNLTDEEYSNYSESTGVGDMITASPPRTYGVGIGFSL